MFLLSMISMLLEYSVQRLKGSSHSGQRELELMTIIAYVYERFDWSQLKAWRIIYKHSSYSRSVDLT